MGGGGGGGGGGGWVGRLGMEEHPIQGGVVILLVASWQKKRDRRLCWPLGQSGDLTYIGF